MKRYRWIAVLIVLGALSVPCLAEEVAAEEWTPAVWFMGGEQTAEVRIGAVRGALEVYAAPRYDKTLAESGDVVTDIRVYGIFNAMDAELAAKLFKADLPTPEGKLYGGVYAGFLVIEKGQLEAGWLLGGALELAQTEKYLLSICTEYQYAWQTWRGDKDQQSIVVGPRLDF